MDPLKRKTLILGMWAPPKMGAPIHLYNLFKNVDPESYVIVTCAAVILDAPGPKEDWLPAQYYFFDRVDLDRDSLKKVAEASIGNSKPAEIRRRPLLEMIRRVPFFGEAFINVLAVSYMALRIFRRANQIIRAEKVESILSISDKGPVMLATMILHWWTRKPYVLFLFDLYLGNSLVAGNRWIARLIERSLLQGSELTIVTNQSTAEYYKHRYGERVRILVIHNSAFPETLHLPEPDVMLCPPFSIVFTGVASWPQRQALQNLILAMRRMQDLPLQLKLYIPNPDSEIRKAIEGAPNIELTFAAQSQMPEIHRTATLLYVPLSWNTEAPDIVATATPGKFTYYLASGRPILIHAPEDSCIARLAKQFRLGLVVDQNNVDLLVQSIREFLQKPADAQTYVQNAWNFFLENCDAVKNSKKMIQALGDLNHGVTESRS